MDWTNSFHIIYAYRIEIVPFSLVVGKFGAKNGKGRRIKGEKKKKIKIKIHETRDGDKTRAMTNGKERYTIGNQTPH